MITTILEVLVAVVVLIVIIAVAALHFLRADDSDTFDDMPAEPRRTSAQAAEPRRTERDRPRRGEPVREQRGIDDRGARQPAAAYGDRGGSGRPRPADEDRRNSQGRPVPVGARPAKPSRPATAEPAANGWDSLSDVDYWAEVAADKPLATAETQALPRAKAARRGIEPKADAPRPADLPAARADSGPLPVRQRSQSQPHSQPQPNAPRIRARYPEPGRASPPGRPAARDAARACQQRSAARNAPRDAASAIAPGPASSAASAGCARRLGRGTGFGSAPGSEGQPLRRPSQTTASDGR